MITFGLGLSLLVCKKGVFRELDTIIQAYNKAVQEDKTNQSRCSQNIFHMAKVSFVRQFTNRVIRLNMFLTVSFECRKLLRLPDL